ncbi:hypothetical protein NMY22_g13979 [Coprinellus aureogranulatus]|nr:hypothetical protein NMY22_g13979 [Coprinellus aureogranulatus]
MVIRAIYCHIYRGYGHTWFCSEVPSTKQHQLLLSTLFCCCGYTSFPPKPQAPLLATLGVPPQPVQPPPTLALKRRADTETQAPAATSVASFKALFRYPVTTSHQTDQPFFSMVEWRLSRKVTTVGLNPFSIIDDVKATIHRTAAFRRSRLSQSCPSTHIPTFNSAEVLYLPASNDSPSSRSSWNDLDSGIHLILQRIFPIHRRPWEDKPCQSKVVPGVHLCGQHFHVDAAKWERVEGQGDQDEAESYNGEGEGMRCGNGPGVHVSVCEFVQSTVRWRLCLDVATLSIVKPNLEQGTSSLALNEGLQRAKYSLALWTSA